MMLGIVFVCWPARTELVGDSMLAFSVSWRLIS